MSLLSEALMMVREAQEKAERAIASLTSAQTVRERDLITGYIGSSALAKVRRASRELEEAQKQLATLEAPAKGRRAS